MSRRSLVNLINTSVQNLPVNDKFCADVKSAIVRYNMVTKRKPSVYYKPSSLVCMRQMFFTRLEYPQDDTPSDYQMIGMADTGTRRHEAIQEVLLAMKDMGYDWEYVNVADYVREQQEQGKCKNLRIGQQEGAETHLYDDTLMLSFRVDGIIKQLSTNEYYLFEFKNQTSFKYAGKKAVDLAHVDQVTCYCMELCLDKALVLYENRDLTELNCPEVFNVTTEMKTNMANKLTECENFVLRREVPKKHSTDKPCRFCSYKVVCRKAGE